MKLSFFKTLKEWCLHSPFERQPDLSFEIEGRKFTRPQMLRRVSGRILSKPARLSWFVFLDGQPSKIYECHSESQALFIESASKHPVLQVYFPSTLMRIGVYIVAKWIKGKPVTWRQVRKDPGLLGRIAKVQALIHTHTLEQKNASDNFDYIKFLKIRLQKYKSILPLENAIRMIYRDMENTPPTPTTGERISHPDLTADNIIIEKDTGNLKIIDNELLTQNNYFLIDLFNTHYSFGHKFETDLRKPYMVSYINSGGDVSSLLKNERFYSALWYLRLIGSSLQIGAIETGIKLAHMYTEGSIKPPQLFKIVKEIL